MSGQRPADIGLGLWKIPKDACADVVYNAISVGYRHLDSACDYGNEAEVGKAIATFRHESSVPRDQLFIVPKSPTSIKNIKVVETSNHSQCPSQT